MLHHGYSIPVLKVWCTASCFSSFCYLYFIELLKEKLYNINLTRYTSLLIALLVQFPFFFHFFSNCGSCSLSVFVFPLGICLLLLLSIALPSFLFDRLFCSYQYYHRCPASFTSIFASSHLPLENFLHTKKVIQPFDSAVEAETLDLKDQGWETLQEGEAKVFVYALT